MVKYGTLSQQLLEALKDYCTGNPISPSYLRLLESWGFVKDGKITAEGQKLMEAYNEAGAVSISDEDW